MTGKELTERLISNLEKSIKIRKDVRNVSTQIALTPLGHDDLKEFGAALNIDTFDKRLKDILPIINWRGEILINQNVDNKIDVEKFFDEVINNQHEIGLRLQYILDDGDLIFTGNNKQASDLLIKISNQLNQSAR